MKASIIIILLICNWTMTVAMKKAPEMMEIPAGKFIMGPNAANHRESPNSVDLPAFHIDRFETSNSEYKRIIPSHRYPKGADLHPVTGINWKEAQNYCKRIGKRLPSSAEWEKAARGVDGRIYPWGDKAPKRKAHPYFSGLVKRKTGHNKKDRSPYGVRDMAGSVWEWTSDHHADGKAVTRGGLWNFHLDYEYSKTYEFSMAEIDKKFPFLGFRCAR